MGIKNVYTNEATFINKTLNHDISDDNLGFIDKWQIAASLKYTKSEYKTLENVNKAKRKGV